MSKAKESASGALAKLDAVKGQFMASLEKTPEQLRKVRDRENNKAKALHQLKVIDKAEREATVVKILDEQKS